MGDAEAAAQGGRLVRFWRAIPRKPYLVAALFILAFLHFFSAGQILTDVKAFCDQVVVDLWQIKPVELAANYAEGFMACDPADGPLIELGAEDCSLGRFVSLTRPFRILLDVISEVAVTLSTTGNVIFAIASVLSLFIALALAVAIIAAIEEELFIFSLVLTFPLTPIVFGVLVFVMKWVAYVLFSALGGLIGLLLSVGVIAAALYKVWTLFKDVDSTAKDLEAVAVAMTAMPPLPADPTAKPDAPAKSEDGK